MDKIRCLIVLSTFGISYAHAQKLQWDQSQIKVSGVLLPIGILNMGIEVPVHKKTSLQSDVLLSPWKSFAGHRALVAMGNVEGRLYFKEALQGWYAGVNMGAGVYELTKWNYAGSNKFQRGFTLMAGASIGYQHNFSDRWGIDIHIGGGTVQSFYRGYEKITGKYITRYEYAVPWNRSGEQLPYRTNIMLVYRL